MRALLVVGLLGLAVQDRATVVAPRPVDATVRAYEITGWSVQLPTTLYKPPATLPTLASPPAPINTLTWNLTIRYADNVGTEYVDVHVGPDTPQLVTALFDGPGGSIRARLLKHLMDEKKIPLSRITK